MLSPARNPARRYCLPFTFGGRTSGIDVTCRGTWLIELDEVVPAVPGLMDADTAELRGTFELSLARGTLPSFLVRADTPPEQIDH